MAQTKISTKELEQLQKAARLIEIHPGIDGVMRASGLVGFSVAVGMYVAYQRAEHGSKEMFPLVDHFDAQVADAVLSDGVLQQ